VEEPGYDTGQGHAVKWEILSAFKLATVLSLPSDPVLMTWDGGLKCGPHVLLCPPAIHLKAA